MARHLLLLRATAAAGQTTAACAAVAAAFVLCAFAAMACAHRGRGWRQLLVSRQGSSSDDPVISNHRVQPGLEGDVCLWQRSILMGEKCQLPDFSGAINYDAAGNLVKKPSVLDELRALQ